MTWGGIEAAVTVRPSTLDLATTKKRFRCLIDLPESYDEAEIDPGSLKLFLQYGSRW